MIEHFTLEELIKTNHKIENKPNEEVKKNLQKLCETVLEPIRQKYGKPIIVNSGYRCKKLNTAVGGAKNSDHLYGCAADIRSVSDKAADNKELFEVILSMVGLLQCRLIIDEHGYNWIHISINNSHNGYKNNQILHLK